MIKIIECDSPAGLICIKNPDKMVQSYQDKFKKGHQQKGASKNKLTFYLKRFKDNILDFNQEDILFQKGENLNGIFFLIDGAVKLQNTDGQEPVTFYIARAGDFLGLNDLFHSKSSFSAKAVALKKTKTSFIQTHQYFELINTDPPISITILNRINDQIERLESHSGAKYYQEAWTKVLHLVNMLINDFGLDKKNNLDVPLTPEDLADLSGISKSYMRKLLPGFREEGLFESKKQRIHVIDRKKIIKGIH